MRNLNSTSALNRRINYIVPQIHFDDSPEDGRHACLDLRYSKGSNNSFIVQKHTKLQQLFPLLSMDRASSLPTKSKVTVAELWRGWGLGPERHVIPKSEISHSCTIAKPLLQSHHWIQPTDCWAFLYEIISKYNWRYMYFSTYLQYRKQYGKPSQF